jgi:hypothetical protein
MRNYLRIGSAGLWCTHSETPSSGVKWTNTTTVLKTKDIFLHQQQVSFLKEMKKSYSNYMRWKNKQTNNWKADQGQMISPHGAASLVDDSYRWKRLGGCDPHNSSSFVAKKPTQHNKSSWPLAAWFSPGHVLSFSSSVLFCSVLTNNTTALCFAWLSVFPHFLHNTQWEAAVSHNIFVKNNHKRRLKILSVLPACRQLLYKGPISGRMKSRSFTKNCSTDWWSGVPAQLTEWQLLNNFVRNHGFLSPWAENNLKERIH